MSAWLQWAGAHFELVDIDRFLHELAPRGPFALLSILALRAEHRDACDEALREGRAVRDVALVHWPHLVRRYRVFQNGPWCFAGSRP